MKAIAGTGIFALLALTIGQASAQSEPFSYQGAPLVRQLVAQLVTSIGRDCGDIDFDPRSNVSQGVEAMRQGRQDTALMVKPLDAETCEAHRGARQIVVARDRMPLLVNSNNGMETCDLILTDDVPGYSSGVPGWAEALQLIYGGVDGLGTAEACSAPARANLIQNWSRLWKNNCQDSQCEALRFAFRRGDDHAMTEVLQSLLDLKAFCNGKQDEDLDPLRTDCSQAFDVDWCPKGSLGVVQAVEISKELPIYPRIGCALGNFEFGFNSSGGDCPDGSASFAGFLCSYPRNCLDRFGCISSFENGSPLNPFMDGRVYNELRFDENLVPIEMPEKSSPSFIYFNGHCTGGVDGLRTDGQLGCLIHQISCSMAVTSAQNVLVPVTETAPGSACADEIPYPSRAAVINDAPINILGPGYPLSRPLYFSTLGVPIIDGQYMCEAIENDEERKFCGCMFNKSILDEEATRALNDPVDAYKILECGDVQ